jgi:hypothetical protein
VNRQRKAVMAALGLIRGRPWRWDEDDREGQRPHSRLDAIALAATVKVKRSQLSSASPPVVLSLCEDRSMS